MYKSLRVTLETWQAITRISAMTGEPRTKLIARLVEVEERYREHIAHDIAHSTGRSSKGDAEIPH